MWRRSLIFLLSNRFFSETLSGPGLHCLFLFPGGIDHQNNCPGIISAAKRLEQLRHRHQCFSVSMPHSSCFHVEFCWFVEGQMEQRAQEPYRPVLQFPFFLSCYWIDLFLTQQWTSKSISSSYFSFLYLALIVMLFNTIQNV